MPSWLYAPMVTPVHIWPFGTKCPRPHLGRLPASTFLSHKKKKKKKSLERVNIPIICLFFKTGQWGNGKAGCMLYRVWQVALCVCVCGGELQGIDRSCRWTAAGRERASRRQANRTTSGDHQTAPAKWAKSFLVGPIIGPPFCDCDWLLQGSHLPSGVLPTLMCDVSWRTVVLSCSPQKPEQGNILDHWSRQTCTHVGLLLLSL